MNVIIDNIPEELTKLNQWVLWRYSGGHKVPMTIGASNAMTNDRNTWSNFELAWMAYENYRWAAGIGFVFTPESGFYGVDLDSCRDPDSGAIDPWAQAVLELTTSYAEVSPSGTGVKIFVRGNKGQKNSRTRIVGGISRNGKRPAIEVYYRGFFTVTGLRLPDSPGDLREPIWGSLLKEIGS